ncbi:MAG: polymer-forming cytoskeletal protein [Deltaproteobacteria bacterium]|jgi:cytoskeletal protein CcmA (bactofilin family)|nr:polymer-forming cytoskeletal protein [Deltaproteobacteria bacterium]
MKILGNNIATKDNLIQGSLAESNLKCVSQSETAEQDIIKTAIGYGTIIEGKFKFDSPVRIDGELSGEIVSDSILIVGETAVLKAQIKVGSLIVYGKIIGDIFVDELVNIKSDGLVEGNITTKRIAIDDGGYFKGTIAMG